MAKQLVPDDVVEQILVRLDVKDLIRFKSVCHSWLYVISSPFFVKAHLKHAYMTDHNNPQLGHRRVCLRTVVSEDMYLRNLVRIVGSCNGLLLLCVSPRGFNLVVTNPSTREHKELPTPPYRFCDIHYKCSLREVVSWGFGYDSSADDYKVIAGFMKRKRTGSKVTVFHVLTLKSNTWKFIGQVKYWRFCGGVSGILCGGALHWIMTCKKKNEEKKTMDVIISLDLSTEEFKEIPLPDASLLYEYGYNHILLGVIEECLCIYTSGSPPSTKKWVMRNNKWEVFIDDHRQSKYDIVHYLPFTSDAQMNSSDCVDDGNLLPANGAHVRASIFVKSLVSPHPHDVSFI
ncbi:putative F-box domain-containing protein [Helianthus annuus]|nr:putative F-box domain-containing protein [Helianthus annuus]KAJ0552493.1 putative F-box domain-containing protein [Helianthus annuus]KAJ0721423.1 putative F-box domain-containing protein [Helianthus annuus]